MTRYVKSISFAVAISWTWISRLTETSSRLWI